MAAGDEQASVSSATNDPLQRLRARFQVFDKNNEGFCDAREVGTILRSLGVNPSERQLNQLVNQMLSSSNDSSNGTTTMISLARFIEAATPILALPRDNEDTLYRAFQTLDVDKKGYLTKEELRSFVTRLGEPMTEAEADEMITASVDPQDGKVYYDEYVSILAQY